MAMDELNELVSRSAAGEVRAIARLVRGLFPIHPVGDGAWAVMDGGDLKASKGPSIDLKTWSTPQAIKTKAASGSR